MPRLIEVWTAPQSAAAPMEPAFGWCGWQLACLPL